MPALLWPRAASANSTAIIRLGRAAHWLSVVGAALVLVFGLYSTVRSYQAAAISKQQAAAWDKRHPDNKAYDAISDPLNNEYSDLIDWQATQVIEPRPLESDGSMAPLLFAVAAGAALAMAGRGGRYILANE